MKIKKVYIYRRCLKLNDSVSTPINKSFFYLHISKIFKMMIAILYVIPYVIPTKRKREK